MKDDYFYSHEICFDVNHDNISLLGN